MNTGRSKTLVWTNYAAAFFLVLAPTGMPVAQAQQQTALEEVIVTAQKREELVQDAPLAVTALSAEQLDRLGISSLGDLGQGAVPSLKVQPYANSVATLIISIRGVGAEDAGSITTESPVGVYVDGVYLGRGQGLGADILDLERLEVLRGPQGSLYGRNSIGGAVSFVTLKPSGEFGFKQKFTYGADWDYYRSISQIDLPGFDIGGGRLSAKISYLKTDRDGWVENAGSALGADFGDYWSDAREGGRLALRWDLDNWVVDYSFDYAETEVGQAWFQLNESADGVATRVGSRSGDRDSGRSTATDPFKLGTVGIRLDRLGDFLTAALGTNDLSELDDTLTAWRTAANEGSRRQERTPHPVQVSPTAVDTKGHTLNIAYQLSEDVLLKSITGYREVSQVTRNAYAGAFGGGFTNLPTGDIIDQSQWSQEFQIVGETSDGGIRYVGGIYYYEEEVNERQGDFRTHYVTLLDIVGLALTGQANSEAVVGLALDPEQGQQLEAVLPQLQTLFGLLGADPPMTGLSFLTNPLLDSDGNPIVAKTQGRVADVTDPIGSYLTEIEAEADSLAIYGQFEYDLDELMTLTVGLRYTEDDREAFRKYDNRSLARERVKDTLGPDDLPGAKRTQAEGDHIDYTLALDYRLSENSRVYARYATGYKSGGVDRRSLAFGAFEDEELDSLEFGYKARFWENTAQLHTAVFFSEYENRQSAFTDPLGRVTDNLTLNAEGTVDLNGFELELSWLPLAGLQLGLNYIYLDYDFPLQSHDLDDSGGEPEDFMQNGSLFRETDLEFHVAQAPRHSGSFTVDYTLPPLSFGSLSVHADWNSSSPYRYSPRLNRRLDAWDILNARVSLDILLGEEVGELSVALWGTNILDEEYVVYSLDELNSGNQVDAYGRPRTYGVDVVYEF